MKTKFVYKDLADNVKKKDASTYEVNRPLPTDINKNVIGLMQDELGGIITKNRLFHHNYRCIVI